MEIISTTALISINATFIVQLVSFLVFVYIFNRVMLKPLRGASQQREIYLKRIQNDIGDAEKKLQRFAVEMDEKKEAARKEAFAITQAIEEEAGHQVADIFTGARRQVAEMRDATEAQVAEQIESARKTLEQEAGPLTTAIMEKILDRRLA